MLVNVLRNTAISIGVFLFVNAAFMTGNLIAYGSFIGVDFKERNFAATLDALNRVEAGPIIPHVPAPLAARTEVAKISPTFAPLAADLIPGKAPEVYFKLSCQYYSKCSDLAGGWFVWALRYAADWNGFYASPETASRNFGQIASDIDRACSNGKLHCRRTSWFNFVPPMTTDQWLRSFPQSLLAVARQVAFLDVENVSSTASRTSLPPPRYVDYWEFLNFPLIESQAEDQQLTMRGWFYDSASTEWPTFRAYITMDGNCFRLRLEGCQAQILYRISMMLGHIQIDLRFLSNVPMIVRSRRYDR